MRQPANRVKTDTPRQTEPRSSLGVSGNPSERPELLPELKAEEFRLIQACLEKTSDTLKVTEQLKDNADRDSVKLAAACFIIEREWGSRSTY